MKYLLYQKSFYQEFTEAVELFFTEHFRVDFSVSLITFLRVFFLVALLFLVAYLLKLAVIPLLNKIVSKTETVWLSALMRNKVIITVLYTIPLSLAFNFNMLLFEKQVTFFNFSEKVIKLCFVILFTQIIFRIINTVTDVYRQENSYTTVGIRTFGQLIKMFITFFAIISGIMILFTVETKTIITILGAMTAAVILIFRDAILGFVSGLQISYSRSVKEGDWITIDKGKVDGIVREININLVKIEKFDKSIVTVPTSDLVLSQVTNHMPMMNSGTRKIQRSIAFNVNSFKFCKEEMLAEFEKIHLIKDFIIEKRNQISQHNIAIPHTEIDINGRQLTNIGVFRAYVEHYLRNNPNISQIDPIVVKQLPVTPHGMPLEINCFAKSSDNLEFENIQADIFDHLLTACRKFHLEVMQSITLGDIKNNLSS
ncbi:mechanosensitive ion channel [Weeksella virosa]|uniref:mechanosensitive ion channel family protein n=1 Tax=Weeksella virosa TaxID=1014 RepID=UPI0025542912|nr:mechanosensitive ion channel domain-containing protein [Weeksella virosa]MDK7375813.1 mechanosensitive ion channel [Weeksella virosa]